MKQIQIFAGILILVFSFLGCKQNVEKVSVVEPLVADADFTITKPAEVGLNPQVISELIDSIQTGNYPNRHSLLIYKDDKLVVEEYFSGKDENWGDDLGIVSYNDSLLHDMRSVSKSIVSACIGIAIAQGKIKSVDQPIFDFFEDYQQFNSEGREDLTIKHLLTMTSGLKWNEDIPYDNPENSEIQMSNSDDGIGFVLSREMVEKPGTVWQYNGGTTELLAEIIHRVSGQNVHEFAKEYLFQPLGISKSEWTVSPATGTPAAASGLRLSSRDMLKFGILYLQEGKWNGEQIVPAEWVTESLKSSISRPDEGGYGYQFWVIDYSSGSGPLIIPAAVGNGDQRIFYDLKNKMLIVTTAGNYNQWDIENNASAILLKVYSSFTSNE
ncbi:serine hydrolase domain-containing protein [Algoriphagus yeomjeoni]|uniref:CubicO group peptidase (Beta-lactamase class C family) n=1 Tax=Algoriphagus yeomjeoni TaxID=291403 RepID=A0A327NY00_9BACT|nr:serine hydrolase [Algoriphagus yeomjeoni]RAI84850.1 CubicO group peptidase (beta-lactamase class C family) [Algoriphagus yeomjeoni]